MENKKHVLAGLVMMILLVCNGCNKKTNNDDINNPDNSNEIPIIDKDQTVVDDQIFEGLEFLNVGVDNNVVKTIVINNTGIKYEGSKFSMKIMDDSGNVLKEVLDEIKTPMETGTTLEIQTNVDLDLTTAVSIEYSIIE